MSCKTKSVNGEKKFECMYTNLPEKARYALPLISNRALRELLTHVLSENHCYFTDCLDDIDFVVMDSFFLDNDTLKLLDREMPRAPVLLITWDNPKNEIPIGLKNQIYDVIRIDPTKWVPTTVALSNWFSQPKAKCLTTGCGLTFGTGRWACHARAMNLVG
jgi:hypothetical protein